MPNDSINPLLPRLIEGKGPANLAAAGEWAAHGPDELKNVSSILEVNVPNVEINSIPTVWARPLLFEMALFSESHKVHKQIVGEWRGLLALLALFEFKDLPLTVKALDLSKLADAKNRIFFNALSKLIPEKTLSSDTTWQNLFVILYDNKPIGMTTPTTLVATATDYSYSGINVNWFDGKKLKNPSAPDENIRGLTGHEAESLASWLQNLMDSLDGHRTGDIDSKNLNALKTEINSYLKDLVVMTNFVPGGRTLGILGDRVGVFEYLDKPARVPHDIGLSAVKLISSREPSSEIDLLVIDERISQDWHVPATQVAVYKTKTLNDLGIAGHPNGQHDQFAGKDLESAAEVWNAAELFSQKLLLIRNKANAFPGTMSQNWIGNLPKHSKQPVSVVMPIDKKLLDYLTPNDLNERVTFEQTSDNEVKVRLRLTLSGIDGNKDFTAEKIYSLHNSDDFEILDSVPIVEVFPNFRREGWKANYIAFSADISNATFEIEPLDHIAEHSVLRPPSKTGKRRIWRTDMYPEALICRRSGEDVGLLLLTEPEETHSQNLNYQVGVDFGASGTCVYSANGNKVQCLEFSNRKLSVTGKDRDQSSELFDFFFPEINVKSPFLSLFHPFHIEDSESIEPVLEGHVYYFEDKLASDIVPNLKWSDDAKHRQYVKSFLTQLCIQTSAELVSDGATSIDWKFSYPTAFFDDQAGQYKGVIWEKVIENINDLCALESAPAQDFSESLASARYFRKAEEAGTELGAIFIDIGSSTSDVSVWQGDRPVWQTSLRYAGRDVFLNYLISRPKILETLLGKEKTGEFSNIVKGQESEERKWAVTDVILRKNKEAIFKNSLGNNSGSPEIKELRKYLAFGLGGLFFYLGLGVRSLVQSQVYKPEMPHIYAGGNGALMFRWLTDGGQLENNKTIKSFFQEIFTKALDTDVKGVFNLQLSKNPKHEASHGLVRTDERNDASDAVKTVVAGEVFLLDGKQKSWSTLLDEKMFAKKIQVPDNLENLQKYMDVFNDAASKTTVIQKIQVTDKLPEVRSRVANTLADLRKEKSTKVIVEPIFIIALKHLMDVIR